MKILITGQYGYIASKFYEEFHKTHDITLLSLRDNAWRSHDTSPYDVVIHTAGLAHVNQKNNGLYQTINYQLSVELAQKVKQEGVKQFIFLSSMLVYGDSNSKTTMINNTTPVQPTTAYGISKYQAEQALLALETEDFKMCLVRLPMVYGENSKGNYPKLSKVANRLPIFIKVRNVRSVIYVRHVTRFLMRLIERRTSGVYHPQNNDVVSTSDLVTMIRKVKGKKTFLLPFPNVILRILMAIHPVFKKLFGSQAYELDLSHRELEYTPYTFEETILMTEEGTRHAD